ncbi:putative nucleotidyltransferase [Breznakibacter xylanolyticus]|uniref:Putative nucleotidyltransferase n=1 Tax=Breznakibacter xylanolyticus TaxID=990 RepID=A0A2W7MW97_9BACT|nr:nucleotidyltransferase domain-containing protein [Breznakibacter xylanolyticus]PZX11921.1 putative nucleotidyltransferase [Breznakibacter xylanolyticus]
MWLTTMNSGLSPQTTTAFLSVLFQHPKVKEVILFGSRAKGTFKPGSDIDLALKGELNLQDLTLLLNHIDDLNLPYTFDLIIYNRIKEPALREHIQRVGIPLTHTDATDGRL